MPAAFILREANITGLTRAEDTTACAGGAPSGKNDDNVPVK